MINQDSFAKLLEARQALINIVDIFILHKEFGKIIDVDEVGYYNMKTTQICIGIFVAQL